MPLTSLKNLYVHELRDLYSAETQLAKALPKMAQAATHDELKNAFNMHLDQTRGHIDRLEKIFSDMSESPQGVHCAAMEGLIKEGSDIISERGDANVKDAALIAAAQRVEHYEISGYGTVRTYAKMLEIDDAADILDETLDEESNTDKKLNKIATGGWLANGINKEAEREPASV